MMLGKQFDEPRLNDEWTESKRSHERECYGCCLVRAPSTWQGFVRAVELRARNVKAIDFF